MSKDITRRNFLKGAAASATSLGLMSNVVIARAAEKPAEEAEYARQSSWCIPSQNVEWDEEHDIVIAGYGMAGSTAYVEAVEIDPNVDVVVYDKAPYEFRGGQAIASGQCVIFPQLEDIESFRTYMRAMNKPNPVPEEDLLWLTNEFATDLEWIQGALEPAGYEVGYSGGGPLRWGTLLVEFPAIEGSDFIGATGHFRQKGSAKVFENGGCWNGMSKAAEIRGCKPQYGHAVSALVQDAVSRRVEGVIVTKPDGTRVAVKARKGVLLACGGFESNIQMYRDFCGGDTILNAGSPYLHGDGIMMQMSVGAKLWHMCNHTMSCGYFHGIKTPAYETCFIRQFYMQHGAWCEVAADSSRYYDEARSYQRQHMKYYEHGQYVDVPIHKSQPVHFIFDENCRKAQPIVNDWIGWPVSVGDAYKWSADNSVEIEKGWIVKADTIEELAEKLGRDPAALRASIDRYNEMCDKGVDEDFGRDPATMAKIETAPFYAIEEFPAMPACSGGARRNIRGQVLNWDEEPIPGLYSAGELGSIVSNLYQNGTYLHEAICTARAAIDDMLGGRAELHPTESSGAAAPWAVVEDGEYSQFVTGLHDPYEIIYTIKDHKLVDMRVGEGAENMFMTPEQFEQFKTSLIESQSIGVDAIAGATIDSQAIAGGAVEVFGHKTF